LRGVHGGEVGKGVLNLDALASMVHIPLFIGDDTTWCQLTEKLFRVRYYRIIVPLFYVQVERLSTVTKTGSGIITTAVVILGWGFSDSKSSGIAVLG